MEVSIHKPNTTKPNSIDSFGFFLAGLIDSLGHFSEIPQLVVEFHENLIHVPYYFKKKLGYGIVRKVKNKKAVNFIMAHSLGLEKVCALVHNKLQHKETLIQYNTLLRSLKISHFTEKQDLRSLSIKENSWFTGFFMGLGSFQIKIINRQGRFPQKAEVRVLIQIDQKTKELLLQIKNAFGGSVYYRKKTDTFYYSSTSFAVAKNIIQYFDRFHLMGVKMTQYTLWRKVFLKIQNKNFNQTELDYKWIKKVTSRMS